VTSPDEDPGEGHIIPRSTGCVVKQQKSLSQPDGRLSTHKVRRHTQGKGNATYLSNVRHIQQLSNVGQLPQEGQDNGEEVPSKPVY